MSEGGPVDVEILRSATDGTEEDLHCLIKLFQEQMANYINDLKVSVEKGTLSEVQKAAHKAAGSSAICGMLPLSEALKKLQYLKESEEGEKSELLSEVLVEYRKVSEFLKAHFSL